MAFVLQASSFVLSAAQSFSRTLCAQELVEGSRSAGDLEDVEAHGSLLQEKPQEIHAKRLQTIVWYALLSALIACANGTATAALNFVNMHVKVLFKSSKIVTVMLLGSAFGRLYRPTEYGCMLLVVLGLNTFFLASGQARLDSSITGVALLITAVLCDSLVPNVQQRLLQELKRPKDELVFHTNWISAVFTLAYIASTGELFAALTFLSSRRRVMWLLLLQSVAGYLGILAYLETIRHFGSKVTSSSGLLSLSTHL